MEITAMAVHRITTTQKIPVSLTKAWAFFSDPRNLAVITPPSMAFTVITPEQPANMYPGQVIEYTVRPLFGIPLYWMTEITQVQPMQFFIDEQRVGPYALWHHQHHFKEIDGGVEMTDLVHYKNPLGFIGGIANSLFVKKKVESIFTYRFQKVEELFGKWGS
jgi:ligand-binding SRPBCC domain-containing protein